jgi:hypothetical protein
LASWLPAAYAPIQIDAGVPYEIDEESATLLATGDTVPGLRYTVVSRVPEVSQNLDAEPVGTGDQRERLFGDIAAPIVTGAVTPLDKALRLEAHFRTFTYDERVNGGHTVERLSRFLEEGRGYCEQFAATMTLMLRGLGVPARVAVGFLPGRFEGREYLVTTKDAHAWVEALIPGDGWVPFDPTPTRGQPTGGQDPEEESSAPTPPPAALPEQQETPPPAEPQEPIALPAPEEQRSSFPLVPLAVVALLVAIVPGAKAVRREVRRTGSPSERVLGAYAELVDHAADLGHVAAPSETQWELHRRVFAGVEAQSKAAGAHVVEAAVRTLYGAEPLTTDEAAVVWRSLRAALASLHRTVPWWRRLLAHLDPRTLLAAIPLEGTLARLRSGAAPT